MDRLQTQLSSLIATGEAFDFDASYSFAAVLAWMKECHEALAGFPVEQIRFELYCLNHLFGYPRERVGYGIDILKKTLRRT